MSDQRFLRALRAKAAPYVRLLKLLRPAIWFVLVATTAILLVMFNTLRPDLADAVRLPVHEELLRGVIGLSAETFGIAVYASIGGFALCMSVARQYSREGGKWEPGRLALFAYALLTGVPLLWVMTTLAERRVDMKAPSIGVALACWLIIGVALSTCAFVRSRKAFRWRSTVLFAVGALMGILCWSSAVLTVVQVVFTLWANHRLTFQTFSLTPYIVSTLMIMAISLGSLSLAHRRFSGVALATFLLFAVLAGIDLKDAVAMPFVLGHVALTTP